MSEKYFIIAEGRIVGKKEGYNGLKSAMKEAGERIWAFPNTPVLITKVVADAQKV